MNRMRLKLLILFVFISLSGYSQNLVLNPSFEDTLTIPCSLQVFPQLHCSSWFMPTNGSVDYYSTDYCGGSNVPTNIWGFQYARTGNSYCGLCTFGSINFPNSREYLEGQLIDTLKQGHTYCVSFYAVKSDSGKYYTSNIGMYLSPNSSVDYSTALNLPYTPQLVNTNGIIYDTLIWTQISGNYVAGGGEKYFIIGNFNNDANTTLDSNNQANLFYAVSYYFIDDVSVVDCTVGINEIESYKNKISLLPNPAMNKVNYYNKLNKGEAGKVIIYSKIGVEMDSQLLHEGINNLSFDLTRITPGVYIVETSISGKVSDRRKLVIVK